MRLALRRPKLLGLLHAAAVLTALFSLVTLADSLHRLVELFSHFRLQYLGASLLLTLAFLLYRDWRWALLMLAVAAVNTWPVAEWYAADGDVEARSAPALKLLLANVYSGNDNARPFLKLLEAEQPDVIVVQEVTNRWVNVMEQVRAAYPHRVEVPQNDNFGIGVYAKGPFISVETVASPPYGFPTLIARYAIGDTAATLVATHPIPPMGKIGYESRNEQLDSIAGRLASIDGPKLLVGDLNISMWSHVYRALEAETGLTNTRRGFGAIPTWPRQLPFGRIPIDHCLVSPHFAVLDTRRGPNIGSDHLPLIVELALP